MKLTKNYKEGIILQQHYEKKLEHIYEEENKYFEKTNLESSFKDNFELNSKNDFYK